MTTKKTPILDAAILAAAAADWQLPDNWEPVAEDRRYAQSLIGELLEGMDGRDLAAISPAMVYGFNAALESIKRRAGIGDEIQLEPDTLPTLAPPISHQIMGSNGERTVKKFRYNFGDCVALLCSAESGTVIGRAEYTNAADNYLIRYQAADGRQVENWHTVDAIDGIKAAAA